MAESKGQSLLYALLGLNRAGKFLWVILAAIGVLGLGYWQIERPRLRFSEEDERLFLAARHGDVAGVERSLAAGSGVDDAAPIDGKTALFRAAVLAHGDVVRLLLAHGADPARRGNDGQTALEAVVAARGDEHDPAVAQRLDSVAAILREAER